MASALALTDLFTLAGRTALVTGASAGIGLHIARVFAGVGAAVALAARRLDKVVAEAQALNEAGHQAVGVFLDVARPETIAQCMDAAESALGAPIDILFNNAGVILSKPFLEQSEEEIDRILDTNLKGALLTAQEAAQS